MTAASWPVKYSPRHMGHKYIVGLNILPSCAPLACRVIYTENKHCSTQPHKACYSCRYSEKQHFPSNYFYKRAIEVDKFHNIQCRVSILVYNLRKTLPAQRFCGRAMWFTIRRLRTGG
ncbi:unnamed protein product [Periconia digitata]|uniref:Uncharacterized protein n=1 Tax=Periconia digitata TaxID=1303443 RepID=A0A9W4UGR2_9PLEO|nr:unnamed protein product [Periconia digitata]